MHVKQFSPKLLSFPWDGFRELSDGINNILRKEKNIDAIFVFDVETDLKFFENIVETPAPNP